MSAIDDALLSIERSFGKGTAARLGDPSAWPKVEAIPTGAITLDVALGIGGMPRGRIVEVYGPESSGKTTLVLQVVANAQAMGLQCAMIDAEHALDPTYAKALGVDVEGLIFSQPDWGEQGLEVGRQLVKSGELGVLVVDSVAALTPKAELDGEIGDQTVGALARMMSQTMRVLAGEANRTRTLVIFTNQIREKVGIVYGSPETQPGGRALKFYSSQRLDVRRVSAGSDMEHNRTKVTVKKNKVAPPFRVAEFDIEFGRGVSRSGCLLDLGLELGVVHKSGNTWADHNGEKVAVGRDKAKGVLDADPERLAALDAAVRAAAGLPV